MIVATFEFAEAHAAGLALKELAAGGPKLSVLLTTQGPSRALY